MKKQVFRKVKKVMVFGTFDLLHPGHINFFSQAKQLGRILIVSVARDRNVKKFKGYAPVFNEKKRVDIIKRHKIADKVVLGDLNDPWKHIKKERPDIIALGYDQKPYVSKNDKTFLQDLKKHDLNVRVVRLRAFLPQRYKSKIIRKRI
jgi:FAD synthetase